MVKLLAFFLAYIFFSMIIATPLVQYIPQPMQEIFLLNEENYEFPYSLTVAVPEENFSWEDPEQISYIKSLSFAETDQALSVIDGLEEINDYEYIYYIYDQELKIELFSFIEGSIQYINFSIYSDQMPYFIEIYNTASQVAANIKGAKILDYQNELFVTDQNINDVEDLAEEWFLSLFD